MRQIVGLTVVLVLGVIMLGVAIMAIRDSRESQRRELCKANLEVLGLGLQRYHDVYGCFPQGTIPNSALPPDKRLSWLIREWPSIGGPHDVLLLHEDQAWDSEHNRIPMLHTFEPEKGKRKWTNPIPVGSIGWLYCPANPSRETAGQPGLTHYVGITGVGKDAALLASGSLKAGAFGYDRVIRMNDITDGIANTLLLAETAWDNGPWTAGGRPTLRGLAEKSMAYLGPDGQFGGTHRGGGMALFADGSVRFLHDTLEPQVFEALATIAGHEKLDSLSID